MLNISSKEKKLVLETLNEYLPKSRVLFFGSRTTGKSKQYSDLDVCVDFGKPIPLAQLSKIEEIFSNSDIPYKIDLVDWHRISDTFQSHIKETGQAPL